MDVSTRQAVPINVPDEPLRDSTSVWHYPAHRLVATPRGPALVASRRLLYQGLGLLAVYGLVGLLVPRGVWAGVIRFLDRSGPGGINLFLVPVPFVVSFGVPILAYLVGRVLVTRVEFDQVDQEVRVIRRGEVRSWPATHLAGVQVCLALHAVSRSVAALHTRDPIRYPVYQLILVFDHGQGTPERVCVECSRHAKRVRQLAAEVSEATGAPVADSATAERKAAEWAKVTPDFGPSLVTRLIFSMVGRVLGLGAGFCFLAAAFEEARALIGNGHISTAAFLAIGVALAAALAAEMLIWRKLCRRRRDGH